MGRIRKYLFNIFNRASETLENFTAQPVPDPIVDDIPVETPYVMPNGIPLTQEEKIRNNEYLIENLDSSFFLVLNLINEIYPEQDIINEIASTPSMMRIWLAHINYKNKINTFRELVDNKINLQNTKQKKIKCLHDLPLQKKLLN
jgi:hypothetical protein